MPCLLVLLTLAFPRLALLLLYFFTDYIESAYHGLLLPLIGFIFVPLTTIVYAWMANTGRPLAGINLLFLLIAVMADLGLLSGHAWHRSRRR